LFTVCLSSGLVIGFLVGSGFDGSMELSLS
jgi:hypothetical protein